MAIVLSTALDGEIDNWNALKTAIVEETDGRADDTQLASYIRRAEARIRRALAIKPVKPMQTTVSIALAGEALLSPDDMIRPFAVELADGVNKVEVDYVASENLAGLQSSTSCRQDSYVGSSGQAYPRYFTENGATLRFWPAQTANLAGTLYYYQELPPLSDTNQTNWLLTDHPDVYLDGALYYAYRAMPDIEKAALMKGIFEEALSEALEAYPTPPNRITLSVDPMLSARRFDGLSSY